MARQSKTLAEKEKALLAVITAAKKKLTQLQATQKTEIGALACKHGLNQFDTYTLDKAFKTLATQLNHG